MSRIVQARLLSSSKASVISYFKGHFGSHGRSKDIRPMTEQAANELIPKVPGWNLLNEGETLKLSRSWKVKSFRKGLEFFQVVGDIAEAEGHHPDLHLVGWNNVKIEIWTHSVGGLTENDFILASKINTLDLKHLLSRKAAN